MHEACGWPVVINSLCIHTFSPAFESHDSIDSGYYRYPIVIVVFLINFRGVL